MVISASCIYQGPSVYARKPVIRHTLGVDPPVARRCEIDPGFLDELFGLLPGLREHRDRCGTPGDAESVSLNHLFEHVCIELQNLAGGELRCLRGNGAAGVGAGEAVVPYEDESVGIEAGKLALELIRPLLSSERSGDSLTPAFDSKRGLESFLELATRRTLPVQDRAIVRAAEERGIPVTRIAGRLVQLGHGPHQQRVNGTNTTHTNVVSNNLAANKDYSRRVLGALGLPVPGYARVYRSSEAIDAAAQIGYPVVVKPNMGKMGGGVSVGMKDDQEVRGAYKRARKFGRSVIVEEFIPGSDYRLLVVGGKFLAASRRVPAHVRGDGLHSIEELVERANRDPRRGSGQRHSWTRLEFDEQSDPLLAELGYERASIPRHDERVYLRRIANTSSGGTAADVTDLVHPENRAIAVRATNAIGLDVAGVDVLTTDISKPLREQGGVICEINSRPGLRKHMWPAEGRPRDVTGPIIEMLFPPGARSRIPIAVVTGTGDTLATTRLLAHILSGDGQTVGLSTSTGVFIDGRRIGFGLTDGPSATRMILLDPTVDVAIVEATPTDVLEQGLGYDLCDVCAIVDAGDPSGSRLAAAVRLVVDATRRCVLVGSDDDRSLELARGSEASLWHVGRSGDGSREDVRRSVTLEESPDGRNISLRDDGNLVARIPTGAAGESAQTALFAAAAALSLGRHPDVVEERLRTFPPDYCG